MLKKATMKPKSKITINGIEYTQISFTLKFKVDSKTGHGEWYFEEVEKIATEEK